MPSTVSNEAGFGRQYVNLDDLRAFVEAGAVVIGALMVLASLVPGRGERGG